MKLNKIVYVVDLKGTVKKGCVPKEVWRQSAQGDCIGIILTANDSMVIVSKNKFCTDIPGLFGAAFYSRKRAKVFSNELKNN